MNNCYVYCLLDPVFLQPFYVGMSKNTDGCFLRAHYHMKYQYDSDKKHNPHKFNKINKIRSMGQEPVVEIVMENSSPETAAATEKMLIEKYGRVKDGGILTNIGRGGEGNTSNHRFVKQYTMYGEYVTTFTSLLEAAHNFGSSNSSAIVECCRKTGKSRSAFGYLWCYAEELIDLEWCWSSIRPITGSNETHELRFVSASVAAKHVGGTPHLITKSCRTQKPYKNYTWGFMES